MNRIWMISPEIAPYAKTGGLGDVAGALPGAIKELGCDVRLGLPLYRIVKETCGETRVVLRGLEVPLGKDMLKCSVLETRNRDGIPVYLFEREDFYDRPNLYGTSIGGYYDNLERFAFLFLHNKLRLSVPLTK